MTKIIIQGGSGSAVSALSGVVCLASYVNSGLPPVSCLNQHY